MGPKKWGPVQRKGGPKWKSLTHLKFGRDADVTFWDTSHVTDMSYMAYELHVKLCRGAMGSDERPRPIAVQFNWTAPLDRPRGRARGLGLAAARHVRRLMTRAL
jgi:hypothetical protein